MSVTVALVKEHLLYDPTTGVFTRRTSNRYRWAIGSVAGCVDKSTGYVKVSLLGEKLYAHRVAWLYMTGAWPKEELDHENGVRTDNRFANLRECSGAQNKQNSARRSDNTSGYPGVDKRRSGYVARFRDRYLGSFQSAEQAYAAYLNAKAAQHDFQPTPRDEA